MVCHGCTFTQCLGMDCPEIKNAAVIIQAITGNLHSQSHNLKPTSQDKNTGTGSNLAVAAAERQAAEEIQ